MYLYFINHKDFQKEICLYEMECLFGIKVDSKYFYHETFIDPSRSMFIKYAIKVEYKNSDINEIEKQIIKDELTLEDYKIYYNEITHIDFDLTMEYRKKLGWAIEGDFSMTNPIDEYCLTYIEGEWLFGRFYENDYSYKQRVRKPHNYSFALDIWLAKTLVNIAVGNDLTKRVIDPCCGVGTVLIEGRVNNVNIVGSDINWKIVKASNYNLEHFGFEGNSVKRSIEEINEHYDVAIVDLPYGKFIRDHKALAEDIINKATKIADKIVFVSMEPLEIEHKIKEIEVQKRFGFSRFVTVIENRAK